MLFQYYWPTAYGTGPTLKHHWVKSSCLLETIQQSENTIQSPSAVSLSGQRRRLWVNIETALGEFNVFADVLG